jgi:plasmid maintenance system antidote protein VapI
MNKLEEIHKQATVSESAEITTDVAIKFAKWIDDSAFTYYDEENIWSSIATEEKKTSEELFEEFIKSRL